jgi:hypothetical protein
LAAHALVRRLNGLGERACLLCPCLSAEVCSGYLRDYRTQSTFVATPDTEAGLNVDCSHFLTTNCASRTVFRNGILYLSVFSLAPKQAVQRLGRAGRSRHTLVYDCLSAAPPGTDEASPVDCALAYLYILSYSSRHPESADMALALSSFPLLSSITPSAATTALTCPSPVLEVYRRDSSGVPFIEYGGTSPGFAEAVGPHVYLFTWPSGSCFSPYLDLTRHHDPTLGQDLNTLRRLARSAYATLPPSLRRPPDITSSLSAAERDPGSYSEAIWLALKELSGPTNLHGDLSAVSDRTTPRYMFGEVGYRAWLCLERLGATCHTSPSATPQMIDRTVRFRNESFSYRSSGHLDPATGRVSEAAVTALLSNHLEPLHHISSLRNTPKNINLTLFRSLKLYSSNSWFNSLAL